MTPASQKLTAKIAARLMTTLPVGSMEYSMTWKAQVTPARRLVYLLAASGRRTSGKGCSGWPTPTKGNADGSQMAKGASTTGRRPDGSKATVSLNQVAQTAGWPTPMAGTPAQNGNNAAGNNDSSRKTVDLVSGWSTPRANDGTDTKIPPGRTGGVALKTMAGWATPTTRDHKDGASDLTNTPINGLLGRQVSVSSVPTGNRGALNPAFSLWLMGYPIEWAHCAERVTPSSRKSRQSS